MNSLFSWECKEFVLLEESNQCHTHDYLAYLSWIYEFSLLNEIVWIDNWPQKRVLCEHRTDIWASVYYGIFPAQSDACAIYIFSMRDAPSLNINWDHIQGSWFQFHIFWGRMWSASVLISHDVVFLQISTAILNWPAALAGAGANNLKMI